MGVTGSGPFRSDANGKPVSLKSSSIVLDQTTAGNAARLHAMSTGNGDAIQFTATAGGIRVVSAAGQATTIASGEGGCGVVCVQCQRR